MWADRVVSLLVFSGLLVTPTMGADLMIDEPFQKSFSKLEHVPCVTLFYRKGRMGCGTEDRESQLGELVYYSYAESEGASPDIGRDFVAVIEEYELTQYTMQALMGNNDKGYLKGVLVLNSYGVDENREQDYYSTANQAPRGYNTPSQYEWYSNNRYPWNAKGQGLNIFDFFGIAMAYVPDSDVSGGLREAANKNNAHDIVADFSYYMGQDGINSEDCLGWKDQANNQWDPKCLPLGGTSVWATVGSPEAERRRLEDQANDDANANNGQRPVVIFSTAIDSSSLFHEQSPGANSAASNILALLMAAKLVGGVRDYLYDQFSTRIVFAFFDSESFGFVGSRAFLKDVAYPGFECDDDKLVNSVSNDENSEKACLYPLRPSLEFLKLGQIIGMLSVDQVGAPVANGMLYVHNDGGDNFGSFVSQVLKQAYTSTYTVSYSSVEENDNYGMPFPPTPAQSLLSLSGGDVGAAVLSGYDYAFSNQVPYHTHLESNQFQEMNLEAIAASATLIARAAVAAGYDGGNGDSDSSAQYALNVIQELSADDETLNNLAYCLFEDGNCKLFEKYSEMEAQNDRDRTGLGVGVGPSLGTPPNYYTGVYNGYYGQPFVQVGDKTYGAYDGNRYGKRGGDAFGMQPGVLSKSIHGLLNDFLGRSSSFQNEGDELKSCSRAEHCKDVDYCQNNGDYATCTGGGYCVCSRSHYHIALDEALEAKPGYSTGYFVVKDDDEGISAMITEPYWSNDVGVKVFRQAAALPEYMTLLAGVVVLSVCLFCAFVLKVGLKKEKMY